jgi:hypothetical protein
MTDDFPAQGINRKMSLAEISALKQHVEMMSAASGEK